MTPACNVRNGNFGTDRTTTTKAVSVRKQLGTKSSKSRESRQEKNGGVMGRDDSADLSLPERLHGEEQTSVGRTRRRMANDRLPKLHVYIDDALCRPY